MHCYTEWATGMCGVTIAFDFLKAREWDHNEATPTNLVEGTSYGMAGFIDRKYCEEAYEYIATHYDIVFQSPVEYNENSGNDFFFIVYKKKGN